MRKLKTYNDGYTYILLCIDALSKFAFAEPIYDKTAKSVRDALEKIFKRSPDQPVVVQTDKGKKFIGSVTQQALKARNIIFRTTKNDVKASIVERFIRTLKEKLWKYFYFKRTLRYVDFLDKIISAYNNTIHSGTKMAPAAVTFENAGEARRNLLKRYQTRRKKRCKYKVGDLVRISEEKKIFGKQYEGGWTIELFEITRVSEARNPVVYYLRDMQRDPIDTFFYEEELSRVKTPIAEVDYLIDEILDTRGRGKNKEVLVSFVGYSDKFNCWIKDSAVVDLVK